VAREDAKTKKDEAKSIKNNNFESKIENDGNGIEQNNDEQRSSDSARVVDDTTSKIPSIGGRGDIRVLEEGLDFERYDHPKYSERDRRIAESKWLVDVAKKNNLFGNDAKSGAF
jgi:hypothetical protein